MIEVVREIPPPVTSAPAVGEAEGAAVVDERRSIGRDAWAASVES